MNLRSPKLLLAIGSVAALLLAGVWYAGAQRSPRGDTRGRTVDRVEAARGVQLEAPGAPAVSHGPELPGPPTLGGRSAASLAPTAESQSPSQPDRTGRLVLPRGTPSDERFTLTVYGDAGYRERRGVEVAANGEFLLRSAPVGQLRFELDARYLRLASDAAEEEDGVLVLRPDLHARLTGRVVVDWLEPSGASYTVRVGQLPAAEEVLDDWTGERSNRRPHFLTQGYAGLAGVFTVDQVPANAPLVVETSVPGALPARALVTLAPGETRNLLLEPEQAAALRGRLVVAEGVAVEDYILLLRRRVDPGRAKFAASIAEDRDPWDAGAVLRIREPNGAFEFTGLVPGHYRLETVGPTVALLEFDLPSGDTEDFVMEAGTPASIEGTVLWEDGGRLGPPRRGTGQVTIHPHSSGRIAVIGDGGEFRIGGLATGTHYELRASWIAEGKPSAVASETHSVLAPASGVVLHLPRPAAVHGVVLDAHGVPASMAYVAVVGGRSVTVDDDGAFRVPANPGKVHLTAAIASTASARARTSELLSLELAVGEVRGGVVLRLTNEVAMLRCAVVDALDRPVSNAKLRVNVVRADGGANQNYIVETDADGAFELDGLWPGAARVTAELTRSRPALPAPGEPLEFGFADDGTLLLPLEPRFATPVELQLEPGGVHEVELVLEMRR